MRVLRELLSVQHPFGECPIELNYCNLRPPIGEQKILRMMLRKPYEKLFLPSSMQWIQPMLELCADIPEWYLYCTIRSGIVDSVTDDVWHVDGFSTRTPHAPEENYIWSNHIPTEFLVGNFILPDTFDPLRHNIHWYFQDHEHLGRVCYGKANLVYKLSPYVVHRRPTRAWGVVRSFVRLSFIPIEIRDNTCTKNPLLEIPKYSQEDFRKGLVRWHLI